MRPILTLLCTSTLLALAACQSNSFRHRPENTNPDQRLATLMQRYEHCRETGACEGDQSEHVLIDPERVWNEIERLALEFPRHVPTQVANATIAYDEHQPQKAERYCDAALGMATVHPEAAILKSRISIEAGNLPAARRLLEAQVNYTPDHAALRETFAAALYMAGEHTQAKAQLTAAERLGAPLWRVAFNRGLIAESQNDMAEAGRQYEACLVDNPEFQPARSRLAGRMADGGVQ